MILTVIMSVFFAGASGGSAISKSDVPSAPPISCVISTPSWCIAAFDMSVELKDAGSSRIWSLRSREGMEMGPLLILENKECSVTSDYNVTLTKRTTVVDKAGNMVRSVIFRVGDEGCKLDFRWPARAANDYAYQNVIFYNVLIGEKKQQLFKAANRIRCRGQFVAPSKCT